MNLQPNNSNIIPKLIPELNPMILKPLSGSIELPNLHLDQRKAIDFLLVPHIRNQECYLNLDILGILDVEAEAIAAGGRHEG